MCSLYVVSWVLTKYFFHRTWSPTFSNVQLNKFSDVSESDYQICSSSCKLCIRQDGIETLVLLKFHQQLMHTYQHHSFVLVLFGKIPSWIQLQVCEFFHTNNLVSSHIIHLGEQILIFLQFFVVFFDVSFSFSLLLFPFNSMTTFLVKHS